IVHLTNKNHWVVVYVNLDHEKGKKGKIHLYDPLVHRSTNSLTYKLRKQFGNVIIVSTTALSMQKDDWQCGFYSFFLLGCLNSENILFKYNSLTCKLLKGLKMPCSFQKSVVKILEEIQATTTTTNTS